MKYIYNISNIHPTQRLSKPEKTKSLKNGIRKTSISFKWTYRDAFSSSTSENLDISINLIASITSSFSTTSATRNLAYLNT